MKIQITCACNAKFDIFSNTRTREEIKCPNCGRALPDNASADLIAALKAYETFSAKLENDGNYETVASSR